MATEQLKNVIFQETVSQFQEANTRSGSQLPEASNVNEIKVSL